MEESEVWAKASHHNDVIFQDNDFEVFVDADGSTHNYKEVELNARNATWNLWLNRPYRDGGHENSTRVDPKYGFDMLSSGMRSAVYVKGHINDPAERLHYWTAELALPLSELARYSQAKDPPVPTSFWRINFSRVEWPVRVVSDRDTGKQFYEKESGLSEENWTWSAQFAVDMHRPEWWGYLHFRPQNESPPVTKDNNETVPLDPEWGVRYVSFQYYYAQHAFYDATGTYTSRLEHLLPFYASREAILCTNVLDVSASEKSFHARIRLRGHASVSEFVARIDENGYIVVEKGSSPVAIAAVE
uniref:Carbohydrate-binding domain-containing protein n=1 Tax=Hyaloperonospora arabidopsidis (strain Emoy2) TaxID=559515 RepID=M4BEE5_HYAAE